MKVRVRDGQAVAGLRPTTGQRLRVMPGVYEVEWLSINRPQQTEQEPALRFKRAVEHDGSDLDVFVSEFIELRDLKSLPAGSRFELIEQ